MAAAASLAEVGTPEIAAAAAACSVAAGTLGYAMAEGSAKTAVDSAHGVVEAEAAGTSASNPRLSSPPFSLALGVTITADSPSAAEEDASVPRQISLSMERIRCSCCWLGKKVRAV